MYIARLITKAYNQVEGTDYEKTFLQVATVKSIWIMLDITACYDYEISQMDVKLHSLKKNFARKSV